MNNLNPINQVIHDCLTTIHSRLKIMSDRKVDTSHSTYITYYISNTDTERKNENLQFLFAHTSSFIHNEYYILITTLLLQATPSNYNIKSGVFVPLGE